MTCGSSKDKQEISLLGRVMLIDSPPRPWPGFKSLIGLDSGLIQRLFGRCKMLGTIAIILVILWLLGLVSAYTMGGFIHILLVIAVVMILVQVIQGRRL
jgi:hypothetical protein